jgi:hypothetical protein
MSVLHIPTNQLEEATWNDHIDIAHEQNLVVVIDQIDCLPQRGGFDKRRWQRHVQEARQRQGLFEQRLNIAVGTLKVGHHQANIVVHMAVVEHAQELREQIAAVVHGGDDVDTRVGNDDIGFGDRQWQHRAVELHGADVVLIGCCKVADILSNTNINTNK